MLIALAFALAQVQSEGPILPPACSPTFQSAFYSVKEAIQSKDFATAVKRMALLPKEAPVVEWNDAKVPAAYRAAFRHSAEQALSSWKKHIPSFSPYFDKGGDIRISFEPVLGENPTTKRPYAKVAFFGEDTKGPRSDFVIGLKRGNPLQQTEQADVFNDVIYAIGTYLGSADGLKDEGAMYPADNSRSAQLEPAFSEMNAARKNLSCIRELKTAIEKQTVLSAGRPSLFLDPKVLVSEPSVQGDRVEFHLQMSNKGDGSLSYLLHGDCGCTIVKEPGVLAPQTTMIMPIAVDTKMFSTDIVKHVSVYTNDPEVPVQQVVLKVRLKPRYRLVSPFGYTLVIPDAGLDVPLYLIPAPGSDMEPLSNTFAGLSGMNVKVKISPWQGVLADPERGEGPKPRKGYKVVMSMKGRMSTGRVPGTLEILTTNPDFPDVVFTFYAQKGIIALPDDLFMGEVGHVPVTKDVLLSRPGAAFKVVSVETNTKVLTATVHPGTEPGDWRLSIRYDGKSAPGQLLATVRVHTNDPKQPTLDIPVRASIQ
jgi:hypothetical protein